MSEEGDMQLAEQYWLSLLDERGRSEVEARARKEPAFQQLLSDTKVLLEGVEGAGRKELERTLYEWGQQYPIESGAKVISWKRWAAVAIAASLVIGLAFFFLQPGPAPQTIALFNEYYQLYPNVVMPIQRGTQVDSSYWAEAYRSYDLRDYEKAGRLFSESPEKDAGAHFYAGQCNLALGETDLAITNFVRCLELKDSFAAQAQWYLALAYLKKGDAVAARQSLEKVVYLGNSYSPRADSILKKF